MVTIESAMLYLYPIDGTYDTDMPLPSSLSMYTLDDSNVAQRSDNRFVWNKCVQDGSLVSDKSVMAEPIIYDLTSPHSCKIIYLGTFGMNQTKPDADASQQWNSVPH